MSHTRRGADDVGLSKAAAHALRHDPQRYGLELDEEGWTSLDGLVAALARRPRWRSLTRDDVLGMVERSPKRRYEVRADRIRARYGHSVPGRVARQEAEPPDVLFHGSSARTLPAILAEGLRPMGRQQVHLSADRADASAVGRRKGPDVVVLRIDARAAQAQGLRFRPVGDGVWLTDAVPPQLLELERGT